MNIFLGSIMTFGFQFPPNGWQFCSGQTLSIAQNTALFSLLGTTYGGDGVQTFQLPNLQGRTPLGQGNGSGLTPRVIGEADGAENVSILISNLPSHTHAATFTPSGSSGYQVSNNTSGNALVPTATNNIPSGSPGGPSSGLGFGGADHPARRQQRQFRRHGKQRPHRQQCARCDHESVPGAELQHRVGRYFPFAQLKAIAHRNTAAS
jgi:microcystin-dependent protein